MTFRSVLYGRPIVFLNKISQFMEAKRREPLGDLRVHRTARAIPLNSQFHKSNVSDDNQKSS